MIISNETLIGGKDVKKYIKVFLVIVVFLIMAQKYIYGEWLIMNWGRDSNSKFVDLESLELSGMSMSDGYVRIEDNDSQLYFNVTDNIKYIQVNLVNIKYNRDGYLKIYLPIEDRYSEEYAVSKKLKEGNNIFVFDEKITGRIRLDFEVPEGTEVLVNGIKYSEKTLFVQEMVIVFLCLCICAGMLVLIKKKIKWIQKNKKEIKVSLLFMFVFFVWSMIIPYNQAPDEYMRYDVVEYIYQYESFPRGNDPILCAANDYGTSYAYNPYLAYLLAAILMKIAATLGLVGMELFHVARLISVVSSGITIFFLIRIARELKFKNEYLLPCLIGMLPQFTFISAYVNNDAFAIMSVSIIVYAWQIGIKKYWDRKSCIWLTIGMALCLASYYNCYGYLLISFLLFVGMHIYQWVKQKDIQFFKSMMFKGGLMAGAVFLVSGGWFVRNYIIFDGDILGTSVDHVTRIIYASDALNPLNKLSYYQAGIPLMAMLFDPPRIWLNLSWKSFVGVFSWMTIYMPEIVYNVYKIFVIIGVLGTLVLRKKEKVKNENLLNVALLWGGVIVLILSIIFSYFFDFQPQGRYLLPAVIPLMVCVCKGYGKIFAKLGNKEYYYSVLIGLSIFLNIYALFFTIIPFHYF